MTFGELQQRLDYKTLDTSSEFIWTSTKWKLCINNWYVNAYNKAIQDTTIRNILKTTKTDVIISSKSWTLPNDFYQLVNCYDSNWNEIDTDETPYRIRYSSWTYYILFDLLDNVTIKIEYIKFPTDMVNTTDKPLLPDILHDNILDFALVEYFKMQRDFVWVANSLQIAEVGLMETISQIWQE